MACFCMPFLKQILGLIEITLKSAGSWHLTGVQIGSPCVLSMFGILIGEREHVLKYTEIRSRYFKSAREVIVTYKRQSRKFCFSE